jgi:predicted GNAT family N-acyltransferase
VDAHVEDLLARFSRPPGSPARVTGPHAWAAVAAPVGALRSTVYGSASPHLLAGPARDLDDRLGVDARADHLCAWAPDGTLAAALRVTAVPCELPALSERCAELVAAHPGHGEIGRVVTDPRHRRPEHITRLFAGMVLHMGRADETVGVLGVCRRRVARFYARFGMAPVHEDPLVIAGRPDDDYLVVAATYEAMIEKGMHRLAAAARAA